VRWGKKAYRLGKKRVSGPQLLRMGKKKKFTSQKNTQEQRVEYCWFVWVREKKTKISGEKAKGWGGAGGENVKTPPFQGKRLIGRKGAGKENEGWHTSQRKSP